MLENRLTRNFAEAFEAGLVEAREVVGLNEPDIDEILAAFAQCNTRDSGQLGPTLAARNGRF